MKNAFSNLVGSSLLAASVAFASSAFSGASAASITFDVNDFTGSDAKTSLTLDDTGGVVKFTVNVVPNPNIGDLRGVFFNILDDSLLSTLTVTGANVTDFQFGPAGSVNDLGGGANVTPRSFDAGVEIGTSGIGNDDFQSTMFTVASKAGPLTLNQFYNQNFGVRLTSVGTGSDREGSSKLEGTAPGGGTTTPVPEPGTTAALGLLAFSTLAGLKKNQKNAPGS